MAALLSPPKKKLLFAVDRGQYRNSACQRAECHIISKWCDIFITPFSRTQGIVLKSQQWENSCKNGFLDVTWPPNLWNHNTCKRSTQDQASKNARMGGGSMDEAHHYLKNSWKLVAARKGVFFSIAPAPVGDPIRLLIGSMNWIQWFICKKEGYEVC